mmetsp:Transcript_12643/g.26248  ORF Transcript_12643/g.26248 Transcript_12643/m.26248 type:complete len:194 (-) Transcript_12643:184-765(-)|eukprot:CAMPEP_0183306654 /NCGR_PEP_ID=MMETSP0160_2-20130417/13507_1 /TAXON_ID=2839 ORGANISM="Odontella Sinensis, Strain Grunow 1884" /NCGR_SAMPLE_ID=MMETSP0160_2 /ASSEMBLY_ACC=CAM_ASM_000250 /LENGTH=193 /DNA_ID=CAMNT_0025470087 /DNA_START=86 /DNA_END=667 /DNA_ORIENTATION=-
MSGFGEPDWASPGASSSGVPAPDTATGSTNVGASPNRIGGGKAPCIQRLLSLLNILLCAGMMALGVLGLLNFTKSVGLSEMFIAVYMILFAALLFAYEMMWWITIDAVNKSLRKNFGFLYGVKGKALYMIFIAFLAIGLKHKVIKWLQWTVGIAYLFSGVLHLFLWFAKPELVSSYKAPTGGLDSGNDSSGNV